MSKRIVMCTSTGCLEYAPDRYRNLGIDIIRIHVFFQGKEYLEGIGFEPNDFYKTMEKVSDVKANLPHSAMPTKEEISKHFQDAIDAGYDEAIVISISSGLGGTWNFIRIVAKDFADKLKVTVIDSRIVAFQEGYLAVKAKELVDKGVPTDQICAELEWIRSGMHFAGVSSRLDYMILNGRLKGGKAFMGKLMGVCPVVYFNLEGQLDSLTTAIGVNKAIVKCESTMKEWIAERNGRKYILYRVFTGDSLLEKAKKMENVFGLVTNHEDVIMSTVTGVHVGPWIVGYALVPVREEDEKLPPVPDYYYAQHPEEKR